MQVATRDPAEAAGVVSGGLAWPRGGPGRVATRVDGKPTPGSRVDGE